MTGCRRGSPVEKVVRKELCEALESLRGGEGPIARAYLVLATDIPHGERNVLVLDGLDVKTCRSGGSWGHGQSSALCQFDATSLRTCDARRGKFARRISSAARNAIGGSQGVSYLPMVGIVVTISPSLSLYRMVVLPAASRPTWVERTKRNGVSAITRVQTDSKFLPVRAVGTRSENAHGAYHQDAHLLLGEELVEKLGEREPHGGKLACGSACTTPVRSAEARCVGAKKKLQTKAFGRGLVFLIGGPARTSRTREDRTVGNVGSGLGWANRESEILQSGRIRRIRRNRLLKLNSRILASYVGRTIGERRVESRFARDTSRDDSCQTVRTVPHAVRDERNFAVSVS